ncbi:MAG: hypothetical protein JST66_09850 [Bacteroidetes bacterium]|nr:hypothetical protein [Bacteroidota bacterium]
MRLEYPAKVLLAWGEAITGNTALRDWLIKNGYPELGLFTFALRLKPDARKWLMDNGHPHLMALIAGIEGDRKALDWLERNNMPVLKEMALIGDGDREAFDRLMAQGHRELAVVASKMYQVKRAIDEDHNDPHKYARD